MVGEGRGLLDKLGSVSTTFLPVLPVAPTTRIVGAIFGEGMVQ